MDIIKIDLIELGKKGLNVQEYLTLLFLYVNKKDRKQYEYFIKSFGVVSINQMKALELKNFIKISDPMKPEEYELREPSLQLFEGNKDLFITWLLTFPVKTPSGRYLSPIGDDTKAASQLKTRWKANFGTDNLLMQKVINILQAEVNWRKKNGKMEYIHNAETWLNQGDWEKYEHLLVTHNAIRTNKNEDYI